MSEELIDITAVAARLKVCVRTCEHMIASGALPPPVRIGRARWWSSSNIDEAIRQMAGRAIASGGSRQWVGRPRGRTRT